MQHSFIAYDKISQLSQRDRAYIEQDEQLTPFITAWPSLDAFEDIINSKSQQQINRTLIQRVVKEQYATVPSKPLVNDNISKLNDDNTFFVITAHQPSLLTGPLYYIYKICSTINLAAQLNQKYADYNIIPVFVSGAEDHDFDEVNHFHLFGKRITWDTNQVGPVGRFNLNGLENVIAEVSEMLGSSDQAAELKEIIYRAQKTGSTYNSFVKSLVHDLFGDYGLITISMDDPLLKGEASDIFKKEMIHRDSHRIINDTIQKLQNLGYKSQAEPREINLFYLDNGIRERFIYENDRYKVLNTDLSFSEAEVLELIENHPDRISPNVVMRPIYQELVLPNLAYVGGGGELAYWQERKDQFDHFQIPMPLLIRRNSALFINTSNERQQKKVGLSLEQLFEPEHILAKVFLSKNSENEIDLKEEKTKLAELYNQIAIKAKAIAAPLEKLVLAEQAKQLKSIDNIESKLLKSEKQKHDVSLGRISKLKEKLFPGNGLQERHDNFLSVYLQHGKDAIPYLINHLNPLEAKFVVLHS